MDLLGTSSQNKPQPKKPKEAQNKRKTRLKQQATTKEDPNLIPPHSPPKHREKQTPQPKEPQETQSKKENQIQTANHPTHHQDKTTANQRHYTSTPKRPPDTQTPTYQPTDHTKESNFDFSHPIQTSLEVFDRIILDVVFSFDPKSHPCLYQFHHFTFIPYLIVEIHIIPTCPNSPQDSIEASQPAESL